MGLYGSPDTGNLYTEEKTIKKSKKIVITTQIAVFIVLYILMFLSAKDKYNMTISYVGVMSVVYFLVNFILMVIHLFKKTSVNNEVIKILISMAIFIICLFLS